MTATIGVLCECNHVTQTGNIILSADELITYASAGVPVSSNANGSKIYDLPCGFYVAISDDISRSHQVVSFLYNRMNELGVRPNHRSTTDTVKLAIADTVSYVKKWIRKEICADYGVSEDEFLHDPSLSERASIRDDLRDATLSTELIVGGFGANSSPVLFYTNCVDIQEQTSPGVFCGGSGSLAALNWLNFRKQNCFFSTQRSYYHVREAMLFAALSPVVGRTSVTILLRPSNDMIQINKKNDSFCQRWAALFHVKDTAPLESDEMKGEFWNAITMP